MKSERGPDPDEEVTQKDKKRGVPWHLQMLKTGTITEEDPDDPDSHSQIPGHSTGGNESALNEKSAAEMCEDPQCDA